MQESVAIDAPGDVPGRIINPGEISITTATLKAGSYQYDSTVPGHREASMVGTLAPTPGRADRRQHALDLARGDPRGGPVTERRHARLAAGATPVERKRWRAIATADAHAV